MNINIYNKLSFISRFFGLKFASKAFWIFEKEFFLLILKDYKQITLKILNSVIV